MKGFLSLVTTILFVAHLSAAIPAAQPSQSPYFADFDSNYTITLPQNWNVQRHFMGLDVFAAAPEENPSLGSRANISVVSEKAPETITLDQFFKVSYEMLQSKLENFQLIEKGQVQFNGGEGRKVVYTHTTNGITIRVTQYFALHEGVGIIITCAAAADLYQKYADTFEGAIRTFKLLNE